MLAPAPPAVCSRPCLAPAAPRLRAHPSSPASPQQAAGRARNAKFRGPGPGAAPGRSAPAPGSREARGGRGGGGRAAPGLPAPPAPGARPHRKGPALPVPAADPGSLSAPSAPATEPDAPPSPQRPGPERGRPRSGQTYLGTGPRCRARSRAALWRPPQVPGLPPRPAPPLSGSGPAAAGGRAPPELTRLARAPPAGCPRHGTGPDGSFWVVDTIAIISLSLKPQEAKGGQVWVPGPETMPGTGWSSTGISGK